MSDEFGYRFIPLITWPWETRTEGEMVADWLLEHGEITPEQHRQLSAPPSPRTFFKGDV